MTIISFEEYEQEEEEGLTELVVHVPRYMNDYVNEHGGYQAVLEEGLTMVNPPIYTDKPVGIRLCQEDYVWLVDKCNELRMPRTVLLRYLVAKYYKKYIYQPNEQLLLHVKYSSNTTLEKSVYDEICHMSVNKSHLWHYCIRQYNDEDEEYLRRFCDRTFVKIKVSFKTHMKLIRWNKVDKGVISSIRAVITNDDLH